MEIRVGNTYRWLEGNGNVEQAFTITKIIDNDAFYIYEGETREFRDSDILKEKDVVLISEPSAITPSHYNSTKITALEVINDWNLDFYLGNTIKYIQRHEKKNNAIEDLEKAASYLNLKIEKMKHEAGESK